MPGGRKPGPQEPHKSATPVRALNCLARVDITLDETRQMTDRQLLAIPNFGRECLAFVRSIGEPLRESPVEAKDFADQPTHRCPHCGGELHVQVRGAGVK